MDVIFCGYVNVFLGVTVAHPYDTMCKCMPVVGTPTRISMTGNLGSENKKMYLKVLEGRARNQLSRPLEGLKLISCPRNSRDVDRRFVVLILSLALASLLQSTYPRLWPPVVRRVLKPLDPGLIDPWNVRFGMTSKLYTTCSSDMGSWFRKIGI